VALRLLLALLAIPATAVADSWVLLQPRTPYEVTVSRAVGPKVTASARVDRAGRYPISRWLKVAPGERAVAIWGRDIGLAIYSADGGLIFRRRGTIGAFGFSPDAARFAFATPTGIELLKLDRPEPELVARIGGADLLRFTERGLVARAGKRIILIEDTGKKRPLATAPRMKAVAAAGTRVVYFAGGALVSIDLSDIDHAEKVQLEDRADVLDAELSPDGRDLVWIADGHIYQREGRGPVRSVVDARDVTTLAFSPDGSAWLWSTFGGGALVTDAGSRPLPDGFGRAWFRAGGKGIVVASHKQIAVWDPADDTRTIVGSLDPAETSFWSADMIGPTLITFTARTPRGVKEHAAPELDP
jgi:hypothetical protein